MHFLAIKPDGMGKARFDSNLATLGCFSSQILGE